MSTTWGELTKRLLEDAKQERIPFAGSFELTARCNFQCKMCYVCQPAGNVETKEKEKTTEEWIRIAKEARDAGALFITLTGGEILLRKDFKEIYESIASMGYRITLYTNGSLITPEIAKWLSKIPPSIVSITLYGGSEETYEKVCGVSKGFEMTIKGIDSLLAEGIKVELKTTVTKGNYKDYSKMAQIAIDRGVDFTVVDYISPRREGCYSDPVGERLSPSELVQYIQYVEDFKKSHNMQKVEKPITDDIFSEEKNELKDELFRKSEDAFRCAAGKCGFWVSWDGRLIPCGLLDYPQSYPFESGFSVAWNELKDKCVTVPNCPTCKSCSLLEKCRVCPARLKAETGFFDKPAPYFCELTKESLLIK